MAATFLLEGKKLLQDLVPIASRPRGKYLARLASEAARDEGAARQTLHRADLLWSDSRHTIASLRRREYGWDRSRQLRRLTNCHGEVRCSFLQGKSIVPPLKTVTVPRLELSAAVLAVKTGKKLEEAMEMVPSSFTFWSDSTSPRIHQKYKDEVSRFCRQPPEDHS